MTHAELLNAATVVADRIEDVERGALLRHMEELGLVVVRGLIPPDRIVAAKARIRERFDVDNDHPATGETPAELYANFQKFSVNGGDFRANAHAQCVRSFYNPIFADDIFAMRDVFRAGAQVRNVMMNAAPNWAVDRIEDGFWTAARIHHYPAGGGFMEGHQEVHVPKVYEQYGLGKAYYQPLIVMSRRGAGADCDYETGGGYFVQDEERVYYEDHCELGDILVYDTRVTHGVSEIDIRKRFRQDSLEGRFAAFVTLYKDLTDATAA